MHTHACKLIVGTNSGIVLAVSSQLLLKSYMVVVIFSIGISWKSRFLPPHVVAVTDSDS